VMNEGQSNRSVAATRMNDESSRSHCVCVVGVAQVQTATGSKKSGPPHPHPHPHPHPLTPHLLTHSLTHSSLTLCCLYCAFRRIDQTNSKIVFGGFGRF
jgi:hypothetical protein